MNAGGITALIVVLLLTLPLWLIPSLFIVGGIIIAIVLSWMWMIGKILTVEPKFPGKWKNKAEEKWKRMRNL